MRVFCAASVLFSAFLTAGHVLCQPISQRDACSQFSDAIVAIDAGGVSFGSGFLVSPDGYILTANHVVRNSDGAYSSAIFITLANKHIEPATPVVPLSPESVGGDYALLKIAKQPSALPFLQLGSSEEAVAGGDATIIGFPFSAVSPEGRNVAAKFCLTGTFAANDSITLPIEGTRPTAKGRVPFHADIQVNVIYFEAPSVKGISGSPLISRDNGRVVGIVSTKLTGIGNSLNEMRNRAAQAENTGAKVEIMGIDPTQFTIETVNVLDAQLANGLGSAVAIDDAKKALNHEQHSKK